MYYSTRLLVLGLVFLFLSLLAYGSSDSYVPAQLVVDYSKIPTLYALDAERGEVHESISHREFFINRAMPWVRFQHHRSPWNKTDHVYRSSACKISAFAVGHDKRLFALDKNSQKLCSFDPNGTSTLLWSGPPLVSPHSIATLGGDLLYIADKGANKVLAFSVSTGQFIDCYWDEQEVPDKIVAGHGKLVGMNYGQHMIIQMYVVAEHRDSSSSALLLGSVFRILRSTYNVTASPIDFGVDGDALYVLDNTLGLIYISLSGADLTTLPLEGITQSSHPSAIAVAHSDTLHLVFTKPDQGVEVIQNIRPASIYLDHDDLGQGIIESCHYLHSRKLLPTETKSYVDTAAFINDLNSQGLEWNGRHHDAVVDLLSTLNAGKGERDLMSLINTGIRVPALQLVRYQAKRKITLPTPENGYPTSTLRDYVSTLNSTAPPAAINHEASDEKVERALVTLNYSYTGNGIMDEVKGTYIVPVPALRFSAFISSRVNSPEYDKTKEIERFGSIVPLGNTRVTIQSTAGTMSTDSPATPNKQWKESVHACNVDGVGSSYVGVVDFQIDHSHPEFSSAGKISTYHPSNIPAPQQTESNAPSTGQFDYSAMYQAGFAHAATENDHGTHIAALAAGNLTGVNPKALIKDVSVDNFETAAREVSDDNPISIYNLSLGEKYYKDDEKDTLRTWIDTVSRDENGGTLFVIAAGNDHTSVVKGMLAFAGRRNNVIVVAASDTATDPPREWLDPDQQHGSNFGYPSVGLYAPGTNIVSATSGGQYGLASGTSQAAALVSGAASLLKGIDPNIKPWQIKERLISTSSLDGWIDRDHSKGGMLHISRAVHNLTQTVVRFSYENVDCIANVTSENDDKVKIIGDKAWTFGPTSFSNIRRIHRISPMSDDFELFISYLDPESGDRHLYRTAIIHSADIVAPQLTLVNTAGCGDKQVLDLSQVDDLYNPVLP